MDNSKRIFTIPNILTFFRIFAVPIMMYFVIASAYGQPTWFLYIGLGVNIVAALTDLVDGYIARHFNQITDLGKILDPFADKLMTIGMFVALVVIGNVHWAFLLVIGLKELIMVVVGALVLPRRKIIIPSNIWGKVAMWFVTIGILMSFFHKYLQYMFFIDWIVLGIGAVITYVALGSYTMILVKQWNKPVAAEKTAEGENESIAETAEAVEKVVIDESKTGTVEVTEAAAVAETKPEAAKVVEAVVIEEVKLEAAEVVEAEVVEESKSKATEGEIEAKPEAVESVVVVESKEETAEKVVVTEPKTVAEKGESTAKVKAAGAVKAKAATGTGSAKAKAADGGAVKAKAATGTGSAKAKAADGGAVKAKAATGSAKTAKETDSDKE